MKFNKYSHFDLLWESSIYRAIHLAELEAKDKDFVKTCGLTLKPLDLYKNDLKRFYKLKREWLKGAYLSNEIDPMLDMHKIASVICRSIIHIKPFIFDVEKAQALTDKNKTDLRWSIDHPLINYKCAYNAAIGIVYYDLLFQLDNFEKSGNPLIKNEEEAKLIRSILYDRESLLFYDRSKTHEDFEDSTIIALMLNDMNERTFDYLAYSNIFYQLQQYAIMQCKAMIKQNKTEEE